MSTEYKLSARKLLDAHNERVKNGLANMTERYLATALRESERQMVLYRQEVVTASRDDLGRAGRIVELEAKLAESERQVTNLRDLRDIRAPAWALEARLAESERHRAHLQDVVQGCAAAIAPLAEACGVRASEAGSVCRCGYGGRPYVNPAACPKHGSGSVAADQVAAGPHLIDGEFQSDKYPTTPRGKVPLSVRDPTAQDLLWEYAQRRRSVDEGFSADLETALRTAGYSPPTAHAERVDAFIGRVVAAAMAERRKT